MTQPHSSALINGVPTHHMLPLPCRYYYTNCLAIEPPDSEPFRARALVARDLKKKSSSSSSKKSSKKSKSKSKKDGTSKSKKNKLKDKSQKEKKEQPPEEKE